MNPIRKRRLDIIIMELCQISKPQHERKTNQDVFNHEICLLCGMDADAKVYVCAKW